MMILIKNIETYSPSFLGKKSILISNEKIVYISSEIDIPKNNFPDVKIIDGKDLIAVPGFIDLHVHITGGGGESGFTSRVPELMLSSLTTNGITTCIGLLGTDGTTRSMANLIAKARSLEIEGLTTYVWTGSYQYPTRTITDTPRGDIILVDKIIGIGELAISDHRASHPTERDLLYLASEARLGGMLSGKCGILHIHIGDSPEGIDPLFAITTERGIPFENILPTHLNRNSGLFKQSIEYLKAGGYIDLTTGIRPEGDDAILASEAYKMLLDENFSPYKISMSSDAGGSLPIFDDQGKLLRLGVGTPDTTLKTFKECINLGISLEDTLIPFTSSPAALLKLNSKGRLEENLDADIILFDKEFNIKTLIAKGKIMVEDYHAVIKGVFEQS